MKLIMTISSNYDQNLNFDGQLFFCRPLVGLKYYIIPAYLRQNC